MPNVVIVGKSSLGIIDEISEIVESQGVHRRNGIITYSPPMCSIDMTENHNDSPYLVVRDTSAKRANRLARALNAKLNIDVEIEVLAGFIARRGEVFFQPTPPCQTAV